MKKKIIGIFIVMLMISSAMTTILFSDNKTVKASEIVNLDFNYVWDRVEDFAYVIHDVDWNQNGENGIPKGRSWATTGEDFTINRILEPAINGLNTPCGLTDYTTLPIGYVSGDYGHIPGFENIDKQYSTKVVIHDYELTLENEGEPYQSLAYSEFFPFGIGFLPNVNTYDRTHFSSVTIRNLDDEPIENPFSGASQEYYYNISTTVLNDFPGVLAGTVIYIEDDQSIPEYQNDTVFLMNETTSCETKIQNITDKATGCILIHDQTKGYNFEDATYQNCSFSRIECVDTNLSLLLNDLENGSEYFAIISSDMQTLHFFNSSYNPVCENAWIGLMNLRKESSIDDSGFDEVIIQNRRCYLYNWAHREFPCKGIILAGPGDTHFMLFTVHGWSWFNFPTWFDVYWVPMFSVAEGVADWLDENKATATVSGFIEQELCEQTEDHPGVESNNVVAYRNISHSPDDKIVVLSNRIDGWFSEAPGDSGVGGAILLGIAKYLKDNNITPKYNLTFLFTTGEEYGMRGAQHFVDTHPFGTEDGKYNYILWIGFDQLGFDLTETRLQMNIATTDDFMRNLIWAIASQTNYVERLGDDYDFDVVIRNPGGAEDYVWKDNCPNTILFEKDHAWDGWHRAGGNDYSEGDSLQYIDRDDVNVTFELAWNVTKYFIVNPDCEFDGTVTFTRTDSVKDDDEELDTIKATMPIKSILPNDKIRVKAVLKNLLGFQVASTTEDYIVSDSTSYHTINVTLPPGRLPGLFKLYLYLYNSTGRINQILSISPNDPNDTTNSDYLFLYPRGNQAPTTPTQPLGPTSLQRGELGGWSALTSDPNDDFVGQKWYMYYDTWPYTPQYDTGLYDPESLTLLLMHRYWTLGTHQIRVKAYDEYSTLLHPYESEPSPYLTVEVTPWCDIIEQQTHQEGLIHVVEGLPFQFYGELSGGENHDFEWNFNDNTRCSTMQNPEHTYSDSGMYNVTFNVTDETTQLIGRTYVHVRVSDLDSNFNMNYYHGAAPDTIITFWNTSKAKTGNHITNVTWDFDDGIISYANIVNHTFVTDGDYNVTLTVKDSANNTDVDYAILHISSNPEPPEIPYVQSPGVLPPDSEATILAEIVSTDRNLSSVTVNITTPNGTVGNYTMTEIIENIYIYTLDNTSQNGQFNFTIWAADIENNTNSSTGNFTMIVPLLSYETPTPSNYAIRNHNWVNVNVTALDPLNTSAFIDWDHSLKGYWPMESYNDTGVYDNSTYENFGTFQNGMNTRNIVAGKYGDGLEFDGSDDYVDVGTSDSLDLGTGDFTFMVWEKSHTTLYSKKAMILTNCPAMESWKGYGFGVLNNPYLIVSQSTGNNITLQGATDVTDNTWHHIAYVCRSGAYSIYVDGEEDASSGGIAVKNITNAQHTMIAYDGHCSSWCYFEGALDEPQLYNRALGWEEINASYNNGINRLYHNFTGLSDGTYSYYAHAIDTTGNQSNTEVRQILIDTTPPTITDVIASPHNVGFGYNVTITADVVDNGSGVDLVTAQIAHPDGGNSSNHTMTSVGNDTFQFVFTDTWLVGQYNYTIWAVDNANNSNSSEGHHFHVSAEASISIATLQDSYSGNQYINITDPPNPLENYTLVARGLTWNTYYNATTGQNILETYQGPVNYQEENGTWTPINTSLSQLTSNHPAYVYGYRHGNDRGLYGVYFKSNAQLEWPVAFTYNKSEDPTVHAIRSKLVGVGYVDPANDWAYEYLQSVQSSQGQTNEYSITYPGVFTGVDVTWSYGNVGLKEEITLSNTTKTILQNHPPSQYGLNDTSSYLVFITKLDYQNLDLYNGSGLLDGNATISDRGFEFKDALGQFKCALPLGEAYELNNKSIRERLTYRIIHLYGNTYLLSGLKLTDLNTMTFPVVVDPTLTVYSTSSDGYIYNSSGSYSTAWSASSGTVSDTAWSFSIGQKRDLTGPPGTDYSLYRGFVFFNTSSLPSNAYIDDATLSLGKKDDYSATDFDITIQNGQPTSPHNPIQSSDYAKDDYSGNGGTFNTSRFSNGYNNIRMSNLSWITKEGMTKLCLRSSRDINGNAPTGNEYINVYSTNAPLGAYVPKLIITYRNQSKIKNIGETDINGYLLIQVQYYNTSQSTWVLDNDTINETTSRTSTTGNQLALDTIFNGHIRASDLTHGTGTYRIYTAFRDPEGNILRTNDDVDLEAWWQFSKT